MALAPCDFVVLKCLLPDSHLSQNLLDFVAEGVYNIFIGGADLNNEEKILTILEGLLQGQSDTNTRLDKVDSRLDAMQADIEQIKEDTEITREAVNSLGEWTEIASDVLKIKYPIER